MSFEERKNRAGQEIVEIIELHLDACRYSTPTFLALRDINVTMNLDASNIGQTLTINSGDPSRFYPSGYIRTSTGEIIAVDITLTDIVTVTARAQFGTEGVAINATETVRLMHKGEADGTCYGFSQTCSSHRKSTNPHIFTFSTAPLGPGVVYLNGLRDGAIKRQSAKVNPGENIGSRATLDFTIDDELDDLDLMNPYRDRIADKGTRFGKLIARHPFFNIRKVVHKEGLRDPGSFVQPDFITREFLIDSVKLSGGKFRGRALDPLILTESKKAKAPYTSRGLLAADLAIDGTSFNVADATEWYYGFASDIIWVRIDSEIMRVQVTAENTLTVLDRGYNSIAKEHKAGATIQYCLRYYDLHFIDVIRNLLDDYTEIDPEMIGFYAETKALTVGARVTEYIISKPRPIVEIINELIKLANLIFRYDEENKIIAIDYIPEIGAQAISLDDNNHFKQGSVEIDLNEKELFTRFRFSWGPWDITKDSDENLQVAHMAVNATLEDKLLAGVINERKDERSMIMQNTPTDAILSVSYVNRIIDGSEEFPKILTAEIDAEHVGVVENGIIEPGKIISIETRETQTVTGEPIAELYQITRINGSLRDRYKLTAKKFKSLTGEVDYPIPADTYQNYDLSAHWTPPGPGNYVIYAPSAALFYSADINLPAFTTGALGTGITLRIIMRGGIMGMGGLGGHGGSCGDGDIVSNVAPGVYYIAKAGTNGQDGGAALNLTVDTVLDIGSGIIWGGGGGQAGQTSAAWYSTSVEGNNYRRLGTTQAGAGGHGGQGYISSARRTPTGHVQDYSGAGGSVSVSNAYPGTIGYVVGAKGLPGTYSSAPGAAWGETFPAKTNSVYEFLPAARAKSGKPGPAIVTNENALSIVSGNNTTNIKGPIL